MYNCRGCDKSFDNKRSRHAHESRCQKWKLWRENILTFDTLYQMYIVDGKSANGIGEELDIGNAAMIIKALKRFDIPVRSISEAKKSDYVKEKTAKTHLEKYGSPHNFSKEHPSRKNWELRLLREEGITNVFQREEVKLKSIISLKNNSNNEQTNKTKSSIHIHTMKLLDEMKVPYKDEKIISDGTIVKYYDIHILNTKKLIEVNGDFWHANPKKYKEDDLINRPGGWVTVKNIWDNDKIKKELANKYGYDIIYIWEDDFSNPDYILKLLKTYLEIQDEVC